MICVECQQPIGEGEAEMVMSEPRYDVLTWDGDREQYTEQEGLDSPSLNVDVNGLRRAMRELREKFGYGCHRGDPDVLVERVGPVCEEVVADEPGMNRDGRDFPC